jgi:hypothetical protein
MAEKRFFLPVRLLPPVRSRSSVFPPGGDESRLPPGLKRTVHVFSILALFIKKINGIAGGCQYSYICQYRPLSYVLFNEKILLKKEIDKSRIKCRITKKNYILRQKLTINFTLIILRDRSSCKTKSSKIFYVPNCLLDALVNSRESY